MFTIALFTIAKTWKQPKCPSTDKGIQKMWCIYTYSIVYKHTHTHRNKTHTHYSAIKTNKVMPFKAIWLEPEINILIIQKEDKYHMISLICAI